MKRFCRENPVERIGYQKDGVADIKKHRWFQVSTSFYRGISFTLTPRNVGVKPFSGAPSIGTPALSGQITIYFV